MSSSSNNNSAAETGTNSEEDYEEIRQAKILLRKQVRSKVRALSDDEIVMQSRKVWDKVFDLPIYKEAKSVGLFLSMPKNEIKTDIPIQHALTSGKDVYIPQVGLDFEKCHMDLLKVIVPDSHNDESKKKKENLTIIPFHHKWPKNKWGIPEPPESMPRVVSKPGDIDLLIVPGLAFDRSGGRCGQGKGYYDRFIARMRIGQYDDDGTQDEKQKPVLVAVALEPSLVDKVPVTPHDYMMDMLILPNEVISFS